MKALASRHNVPNANYLGVTMSLSDLAHAKMGHTILCSLVAYRVSHQIWVHLALASGETVYSCQAGCLFATGEFTGDFRASCKSRHDGHIVIRYKVQALYLRATQCHTAYCWFRDIQDSNLRAQFAFFCSVGRTAAVRYAQQKFAPYAESHFKPLSKEMNTLIGSSQANYKIKWLNTAKQIALDEIREAFQQTYCNEMNKVSLCHCIVSPHQNKCQNGSENQILWDT